MLLISEVAKIVGLHPNTIIRLERRGLVKADRDWNGWRRFPESEVRKLLTLIQGQPQQSEQLAERNIGGGRQNSGE